MIKNFHLAIIGSAIAAALAWFCFSCSNKSDAPANTTPEQIATVNPDLAGKGHNDCLDIFYKKLQALKSSKAQRTRNGGEGEDLPPTPGNDDEKITTEELEEAIANSIAQSWEILLENEEDKEELATEMDAFLAQYEEIKDEKPEEIIQTEDEEYLLSMIEEVLYKDYANPNDLITAITDIELQARERLPEKDCSRFLMATSILRNSVEYWATNYSTWNQSETRGNIHWTDVVDVAAADYGWGAAACGFSGSFGFARSGIVSGAARIIGCYTWQVQLAFTVGAAALGSIIEVYKKCTDDVPFDTDNSEIEHDYCKDILEKAYDIFSDTVEDNDNEEIVPGY